MAAKRKGRRPTWDDVCRTPKTGRFTDRGQCIPHEPCSCDKPVIIDGPNPILTTAMAAGIGVVVGVIGDILFGGD